MDRKLRILNLEDSPQDSELIRAVLEEEGFACEITRVETEAEFVSEVGRRSFDLLLVDYRLPSFDGMTALEIARERCPETPFIFVSGSIGEDKAIEAMKNGATDYVLKDRLARLAPAVRRALNEAKERTERRLAEAALRDSEERYRSLFENSVDAVLMTTPEGRILAANPEACRIFGRTEEEICRLGRAGLVDPADPRVAAAIAERARTGSFRGELTLLRKDGSRFPGEVSTVLYTDSHGLVKTSMIIRDATEHKRLQDEAVLREQRLNSFFKGATAGLALLDRDLRFININDTLAGMNGLPVSEHLGRTVGEVLPMLAPVVEPLFREVLATGEPVLNREVVGETHGMPGVQRHWMESFFPVEGEDGRLTGVGAIVVEITELKRMERAVCESELRYKNLVEMSADGVYQSSREGAFAFINQAGAEMFGHGSPEEMIGRPVAGYWVDPLEREQFLEVIKAARTLRSYPVRAKKADGTVIHLELSGRVMEDENGQFIGVEGILRDVTDKIKLEEQLRHSQKMEAVGTLAGGIAHDFNNILSVIMGFGSLAQSRMEEGHPSREHLSEVLIAAERAVALTQRLLLFGRREAAEMKPVNVNDIITGLQKMLTRIIGEDIDFAADLFEGNLRILADVGQMEQVLMNLTANARDAMPRGGRLTIGTGLMEIDEEFISGHGYGDPGRYALVTVSDTGSGMDAGTLGKIFEPFFTTKGVGQGTGLGLSIAYGIVKQHRGYINVYSEVGKGTTFRIMIPLMEGAEETAREAGPPASPAGGTETILVAEDDASLRRLARVILETFGYKVITAEDGEDAIKKFRENRDRIDLLLLDMIMPRKNGKEVCEEIRKSDPDLKILFMSGYTKDMVNGSDMIEEGMDLITKPVLPKDLLKRVRGQLDK